MKPVIIAAAGLAAAGVVIGSLYAVGVPPFGGPGSFTARGGDSVCVDAPDITDGSQVTVTDSSGKVIGDGTLAEDDSATAMAAVNQYDKLQVQLGSFGLGADGSGMNVYKFTVTVPGGEARYGVSIGKDRGTVWLSEAQMRKGPQLSLGC